MKSVKDPVAYYERKLREVAKDRAPMRHITKRPVHEMPYMIIALAKMSLKKGK